MELTAVRQYLREASSKFEHRDPGPAELALRQLKRIAVNKGDQVFAKEIWCIEQILKAQETYISAFTQLKSGAYREAWLSLEQVELALGFLAPHFAGQADEFHVRFIEKHTWQYQALFPYRVFASPEFLQLEKRCSICDRVISIRESCGHQVGEIYNGEMCARKVTKFEVLAIALVQSPVQKYSVLNPVEDEKGRGFDYSLLRHLVERLQSPFHAWDYRWTRRRHPHSFFKHHGRNEACPCGSGRKYKKCCLPEPGVLRPHCEFLLSVPPSPEMAKIEYVY